MEPLNYNGKTMDRAPINGSVYEFARLIEEGSTIVAELEPGDATYYSLLIVPCWSNYTAHFLGRWGVPATHSHEYLFVSRLSDPESMGCFIHNHHPVLEFDVEALSRNKWSQQLLAWWLTQLWEEINAIRSPGSRVVEGKDQAVERPTDMGGSAMDSQRGTGELGAGSSVRPEDTEPPAHGSDPTGRYVW